MKATTIKPLEKNTVLVALMNNKADWALLHEQHWYRIPTTARLPIVRNREAQYIAWFHTDAFGKEMRWKIHKYAKIRQISEANRQELFPGESAQSTKAHKRYYKIEVEELSTLPRPIVSHQGRRLLFVPTTEAKFHAATNINQIFNDSPLEEMLSAQLIADNIPAERQWFEILDKETRFCLDFAIFCKNGKVNVECDGDEYHMSPDQVHYDKTRNNELEAHGWQVLRYTTKHLTEDPAWVRSNLLRTIRVCGGFADASVLMPALKNKGQGSLFS